MVQVSRYFTKLFIEKDIFAKSRKLYNAIR